MRSPAGRGEAGAAAQRLFVAIDPPPEAVTDLAAVVDALEVSRANTPGRSTRVSARSRWHVTLAFLGDVPARRTEDAAAALAAAVSAAGSGPINVRFAGGGTFGRRRFAILWVGIAGDVVTLSALSAAVRDELKRARLPYDAKPFRPHLTVARPGDRIPPESLAADVTTLSSYVGPMWTVDAVHLVASELGPDPKHTRLATIPLTSP